MSYTEYIASKAGSTIAVLIGIVILLLAIPGWYNLYLDGEKRQGKKIKYIFDDMGYDTSGVADVISMICAFAALFVVVAKILIF